MSTNPKGAASRARNTTAMRAGARIGFAASGVVNGLVGVIAVSVAVGGGDAGQASQQGALRQLAGAPFGAALLWIVGVGLLILAVWYLASGVLATGSDDKERWAHRLKDLGKGVAYGAIGVLAVRTVLGAGGGSGGSQGSAIAALPGGIVLLVLVGLGILGVAGYSIVKGARKKFLEDVSPSGSAERVVELTGTIGYIARGVALAVLGVVWIVGAVAADPEQAGGIDVALQTVAGLPFGQVLLVLVGAGFVAYGVYSVLRARSAKL
ncbi:DUF1206 domain-containing protein [Arenivirga flava]|uniref:DUF1206 domain-containing protein n=1 Tax=Arenivirga flava TaxID=1930060 RepID=A0AA37UG37_9MICO|nr:DUF1206 domain-containing protein [Arenivirga flava]GMA29664.1 hypothetical protein GCM10025874_29170 [Arenivirga flava]